ncbi:MAG: response regulator [Alphaproteobacteria bacterium]
MKSLDERDIVLVVDDSPAELGMLTDALEEAGLSVLVARDGTRALSLVDRIVPDIILMDALMPGPDGFETCHRLKQEKGLVHIPVIFMTGLADTEHILRGLQVGGVDYVTKPIVPDELIARIGVHLANARLAHSARTALDVAGRSLIALSPQKEILWCTPRARALCEAAGYFAANGTLALPGSLCGRISKLVASADRSRGPRTFSDIDGGGLQFAFIGQTGPEEFLFRISDRNQPDDVSIIEKNLALTHREAEVLLWISQGKSNRDIGEILGLSPRTVNKHLEQIFSKLAVENRTSAAILAVRTIASATTD